MKQDYENCTTYTYDAQGSLLSEQSTDLCKKYLYNDFHQCIRTEVIRGREEEAERILQENRYDGEGLRFSLIENGKRTDFLTNGWDNLAELDEKGQVTKRIIRGMGIVASEDVADNLKATEATGNTVGASGNVINATAAFAGTTAYHYYHGNERMDVEYITDEAGQVVNGYTYDAFGTIITSSEKLQNRYTYNGEAFDKTTEQYYLRKRFYNPKLSRFIQEDEYRGDGLNLYAFCANNPVMYVDPSGFKSWRSIYMGYTPQKQSPVGREVISRTYKADPSLFDFGTGRKAKEYQKYMDNYTSGMRKGLPKGFLDNVYYDGHKLRDYDMGHNPKDAVAEWNEFFRKLGPDMGPELARKWMKDPDIYTLELASENRSKGSKAGKTDEGRYQAPETDPEKIKAFKDAHQDEIDKINSKCGGK